MEKITPVLSIIVPVYNVEQYLPRCIDSILTQTFQDFELILVDDGSPDRCGEICDEYAKKDSRIIVIHQANKGVSTARNRGLDIAKGDYISFIDSDDQIGTNSTYEENLKILQSNPQIDILQIPVYTISTQNEINKSTPAPQFINDKKEIFLNWYTGKLIRGYVWDKIFKKDIFNTIRFPTDMQLAEDAFCIVDFTKTINCLYISNLGCYLYYHRKDSATIIFSPQKCLDLFICKLKHFSFLVTLPNTKNESCHYFFYVFKEYLNAKISNRNQIVLEQPLKIIKSNIPKWKYVKLEENKKNKLYYILISILGINGFSSLYINWVLTRLKLNNLIHRKKRN